MFLRAPLDFSSKGFLFELILFTASAHIFIRLNESNGIVLLRHGCVTLYFIETVPLLSFTFYLCNAYILFIFILLFWSVWLCNIDAATSGFETCYANRTNSYVHCQYQQQHRFQFDFENILCGSQRENSMRIFQLHFFSFSFLMHIFTSLFPLHFQKKHRVFFVKFEISNIVFAMVFETMSFLRLIFEKHIARIYIYI